MSGIEPTLPMRNGTGPLLGDSLIADVAPPQSVRPDALVDSLVGMRLGNYEILFVLGRGSYGTVYKAQDVKLGRHVAIKFLHEFLDARHEAMFLREAKAIAALSKHPSIVQIFEWSEHQGRNYFVLEFVGSNAAMLLRVNPTGLNPERAARIMTECAQGLAYAHKQNIIHRDIKPANILLEIEGGGAKLADFGVARFFDPATGSVNDAPGGTPGYIAPEIVRGEEGDPRSDIFSMGATLYELLCGQIPFPGRNALDIMEHIRNDNRISLRGRRPDAPEALAAVVDKALAHDPNARFQTAEAFSEAIQAFLKGSQTRPVEAPGEVVSKQEVETAKTRAFKTAEDAKRAGADKLAHAALSKAIDAFRDGEAHERLKQWSAARQTFEQAVGLFQDAEQKANKIMADIRALKAAQAAMEQARLRAQEVDAPALVPAAYAAAIAEDQAARKIPGLAAATRRYEKAREMYRLAMAEAQRHGEAELVEPRRTMERIRRNAQSMRVEHYANEEVAIAETLARKAEETLPDYQTAKQTYLLAIARYHEAMRVALERRRLESERQVRGPVESHGIEFAWVPPGAFQMGSAKGSPEERPVRMVTISHGFWMSTYPITQGQWRRIMGDNPSGFHGDDRLPVEKVSWNDCQEFVARLNKRGEGEFRLPSEAEWEYACRAGNAEEWCFGSNPQELDQYAWHPGNAAGRTHPVGEKRANAWGLHDMHGNVCEWCEDNWHKDYGAAYGDNRPWVSDRAGPRIARGGSWCVVAGDCRSAARGWYAPMDTQMDFMGFRICKNK